MIDIEFYTEKAIRNCWNLYRDHLYSPPQDNNPDATARWIEKRKDYLTDLLYSMAEFFGYTNFDKIILKKGAYSPQAHDILNMEQQLIRKGAVEVLTGSKPIKIEVVPPIATTPLKD